jgi:citrate synthase
MEGCAALLDRMVATGDGEEEAKRIAEEHRAGATPIPGFGHPFLRPDDPRSARLFEIARDQGVAGAHVAAVETLSRAIDEVYGKHITINATGAIAALLSEIRIPWQVMRGFAVISRAAGLVGHILEEHQRPVARHIWDLAEEGVPYRAAE